MNDDEIRDRLLEVDEDDEADISSWEAEFLRSVLYDWNGPLTNQQRGKALEILEEYE